MTFKKKPTKLVKPLKPLLKKKDIPKKAITVDLSLLSPLEPKVVFLYYIAIQKAYIEEVDIINRKFLKKTIFKLIRLKPIRQTNPLKINTLLRQWLFIIVQ